MRVLLCIAFLLATLAPVQGAVTMAVNEQSGGGVQERAGQLARQLGSELGTAVNVVVLADAVQVDAWLNRYATADLALVESGYAAGKPGQFIVLGPVGRELTLIGRQGIGGDLPQKIAGILGRDGGSRPVPAAQPTVAGPARLLPEVPRSAPPPAAPPAKAFSPSKSAGEDRYFVGYVYREKLRIEPELERLDYWTQQLQSGALSKRQLYDMACQPGSKGCDFR